MFVLLFIKSLLTPRELRSMAGIMKTELVPFEYRQGGFITTALSVYLQLILPSFGNVFWISSTTVV